jgi:hypothetical protein
MFTQSPMSVNEPRIFSSSDKHYQIAYWLYQQGTFVSIGEIEKNFSLSRASLYRELDKIFSCKADIAICERRHKVDNQWHRQLHVYNFHMRNIVPVIKRNSTIPICAPLIWNELTKKNWRCINLKKIINN